MAKDTDYTVEEKEEIRKLGKGGEVDVYFRIWATTKKGTYFHVDVHEDALDKADEVLTDRAKQLDSI